MNQNVLAFIEHLSQEPWSNYTSADYTLEQWHNACLIHLHTGAPTSKSQCKLPVKTPNGALNKNGVQAAAAALAGARGGVNASPQQKTAAARMLRGYYNKMNAQPPPSLAKHSSVQEFIEHHGVRGMKWGVRRNRGGRSPSRGTARTVFEKHPKHITNAELEKRIRRMEMEKRYNELNKRDVSKGEKIAAEVLTNVGKTAVTTLLTGAALLGAKHVIKQKFGPEAAQFVTGKRK